MKERNSDGIRQNDKIFSHILENINLITIFLNHEARVVYFNPYLALFTGYTSEELRSMDLFHLIFSETEVRNINDFLKDENTGGLAPIVERPIRKKDGEISTIRWYSTVIRDDSGSISGISCMGEDITEFRKSLEQLKEKEQQYHNVINSGHALIWISGKDKLCYFFNDTWLKFTGRSLEQEIGNGWAEGVHPDDLEKCIDIYVSAFDMRKSFDMEYRLKHNSGEYRWIRDLGTPNYDRHGDFVGYLGHCFDITADKLNEEAKLENKMLYQTLVNQAVEAYFVHDFSGKIIEVNNYACESLGYTREELLKLSVLDLEQDFNLKKAQEEWAKIEPGVAFTLLGHQKRKDCTIFPVEVRFGCAIWKDQKVFMGLVRNIEARLNSEKEIKALNERISTATDAASVGIWDWDITNNILIWDDHMYRLYGMDKKSSVAGPYETWINGLHPDDRVVSDNESKMALSGQKEYDTEFRVLWPDNSLHYIKAAGKVFRDNKGIPVRMLGVNYDITERKKTEEALRVSNENFITAFNLNPTALAITAVNGGKIHMVNKAYVELMGYSTAEIIGHKPSEFNIYVKNEDRDKMISVLNQQAHVRNHELPIRIKSGEVRIIDISMDRFQFNGEECILSVFDDITERKKAEEALIEHRAHLEELVNKRTEELKRYMAETIDLYENAPCGYHSLDNDGRITRINNTELNWLGYEREELHGRRISELLTPASQQKFHATFPEFLKKGEIKDLELEFIRKDGSTFFVSLNGTAIYDEQKRFFYSRSTMYDISERKRTEQELSKAKWAAEAANRAKSEFLANMSHEIRTPMNAVLGYTDLLGSSITDNTQKSYIESIKSSGRSLLTLINDILDLSKVEAGKLQLEYDFISSLSFFREFENIFALRIKEKKLKFIMELDPDMPEGLYLDEVRLRQVIFNLIGNAIKFTAQGEISLKVICNETDNKIKAAEKTDNLVDLEIIVKDTGIGISEENQKSVFEPFVQEREYKKYGGTGLGLSISKKLIEMMNGSLKLVSEPGKGSIFTVDIPHIRSVETLSNRTVELTIDPSKIVFQKATILVVDDVKHNRDFIKDSLANTELKILEAENGDAAYYIAREIVPDVIISDIRMPEMNGFELLAKLRETPLLKRIPVIAYSAEVLMTQKEKINANEFEGLLVKPLKVKDLFIELMNWIPHKLAKSDDESDSFFEPGEIMKISRPDELITYLETDLYPEWKKFEVRQPIKEIQAFGTMLIEAGVKYNAETLTRYGKDLIGAADSFSIDALLKLIGKYPLIIDNLKNP